FLFYSIQTCYVERCDLGSSGFAVKAPGCLIVTLGRDKRLWQAVRIARLVAPDRADAITRQSGDRYRTVLYVRLTKRVGKTEAFGFQYGYQELLPFAITNL